MQKLYKIIMEQINSLTKHNITREDVIRLYWLTNLACKIVYIDDHFHINSTKQLAYLMHIYNTIITSKIVDLENLVANGHRFRKPTSMQDSFINSSNFDMLTINTLRNVFQVYMQLTGTDLHLVKIPKISNGKMSI